MKEPLALRIQQELLQTLREYSKNQGVDVTTLVEDYTRSLVDDNNCVNAVYVLELENGKWYVGQTSNLEQRMTQHFSGNGAQWTKLHKPVSIKETRLLLPSESPIAEERNVTKQYMEEYGFNNVRGSVWCKLEYETEPDWQESQLESVPRQSVSGKTCAVHFRCSEELANKLKAEASLLGITLSALIISKLTDVPASPVVNRISQIEMQLQQILQIVDSLYSHIDDTVISVNKHTSRQIDSLKR